MPNQPKTEWSHTPRKKWEAYQAQHIIPGDKVYLDRDEYLVVRVEPIDLPGIHNITRIYTDTNRWTFPNGKLVTVTEAAPRPRRA